MSRPIDHLFLATAIFVGMIVLSPPAAPGVEIITLANGMQLEGTIGKISTVNEDPLKVKPKPDEENIREIVVVDDKLRWIHYGSRLHGGIAPAPPSTPVKITLDQRVAQGPRKVAGVGNLIVRPFDKWGRRLVTMKTAARGRLDIMQGITEITPTYTKVEGLIGENAFRWDMRIATSSIPRSTLSQILMTHLDQTNPDQRINVVQLYIMSKRFEDARKELEGVVRDFPELAERKTKVRELRQLSAGRMIDEIELRSQAGQHNLALSMLRNFPSAGVAGETLLKVREMLGEYERRKTQGERVVNGLKRNIAALPDEAMRAKAEPIHQEIAKELTIHTLSRFADYLRFSDDEAKSAEQKTALGLSNWLIGDGNGLENLAVAFSLFETRDLAIDYFRAARPHERDEVLQKLKAQEGAAPQYLSKILAHMAPPFSPEPSQQVSPYRFKLTTPGLVGEPDITYHVQLPPEYHPHRRYPCVLTLHGEGAKPATQLAWWGGRFHKQMNMHLGQASRHGYILLAPEWTKPHQSQYRFSAQEHAAILYSLRDALRRFSIDTNRVFLSGQSMGGDAAWDIALAHPDLWAGVIPIVATADRYILRYWENGRYVPMYFVGGEKDGDRLSRNGSEFDRYLTKAGYDVMLVHYQGRGHEHFHEEILHIFDWMNLPSHTRNFYRREFTTVSMRPWDNFFWWVEVEGQPSRTMSLPSAWPPPSGTRPAKTIARIQDNNVIYFKSGAKHQRIYLSPELVDVSKPVAIGGRRREIQPSTKVMLEDVRTRGDRQNPFWAVIEL